MVAPGRDYVVSPFFGPKIGEDHKKGRSQHLDSSPEVVGLILHRVELTEALLGMMAPGAGLRGVTLLRSKNR